MISRLMAMLTGDDAKQAPSKDRIRVAAAALLVEAAMLDGRMHESERAHIHRLLEDRFGLSAAETAELFEQAMDEVGRSVQILGFTRVVKDEFEYDERVRLIEMLWEVAYADRHLHDYEANLVRRISGLLFVSDQDAGAARKRALAQLGMGDDLA